MGSTVNAAQLLLAIRQLFSERPEYENRQFVFPAIEGAA
jgi:hypothetical protein